MKGNLAIVCQKYLGSLALLLALGGVLALPAGAQVNTASLTAGEYAESLLNSYGTLKVGPE